MYFEQTMSAGVGLEITEAGDFFRIIQSVAEDVQIIFYKEGHEVARSENVGAGYFERIEFDRIRITSAGGGLLRLLTRKGATVGYDRPVASVGISGTVQAQITNKDATAGAFTQAAATVTNASGQLLAAKANRRYLLIQNKDAAGDIYLTLNGSAATTSNGIKIGTGQSYECQGYAPTGAIFAIGSIASNANIVTVEG